MANLDVFKFDVTFNMESANCNKNPEFLLTWMDGLGLFEGHPDSVKNGDDVFLEYLNSENTCNERCKFEYTDSCVCYAYNVTFTTKTGRTILDDGVVEDVREFQKSLSIYEEAFITRYRLRKFQQFFDCYQQLDLDKSLRGQRIHDARDVIANEARAFATTVGVFQKYGYTFETESEAA